MHRRLLKETAGGLTILYAEDDSQIRELFARFLSNFFETVTAAENGRDALELFQNASFDIVLTDIDMPVMGGLELISAIRELDKEQAVVVCSAAYHDNSLLLELLNHAVDGFIKKPIEFDELSSILERLSRKITRRKRSEQERDVTICDEDI